MLPNIVIRTTCFDSQTLFGEFEQVRGQDDLHTLVTMSVALRRKVHMHDQDYANINGKLLVLQSHTLCSF